MFSQVQVHFTNSRRSLVNSVIVDGVLYPLPTDIEERPQYRITAKTWLQSLLHSNQYRVSVHHNVMTLTGKVVGKASGLDAMAYERDNRANVQPWRCVEDAASTGQRCKHKATNGAVCWQHI